AAARERLAPRANVELRQGALEDLPIDDGACDAALMLLALTHVTEPARAAGQMARVLKPGGRAVVVDLLRHDRDDFRRRIGALRNGFEPRELAELLERAGLENVRCETLPPEAEAKGPALLLATGTKPARGTRAERGRAATRGSNRRAGTKRSPARDARRTKKSAPVARSAQPGHRRPEATP
ncbi:MAG: methyltransferase domain-containing protein, partial [Thermoanaerobaculia bacterium]